MSNARRIAKNSVFQAVAFVAQGLTEVGVALVLARLAGAERLGQFTTLVILAGLFEFISDFGLPSLLTREIARQREDRAYITRLINSAIGLVVLLSFVALILMFGVGIVSRYSTILLQATVLTAAALAFESLANVVSATFRGLEALERSAAVTAVMHSTFMALGLAVILLGARIDWLMAAYLTSRIIAWAVAVWLYQSRFGRLRPVIDLALWFALLKKGFPFSINSVFSFAYSRLDVVILSFMAGNIAVGYYESAYTLTMRLNVVARALTFALYPFLSAQYVRDSRSMRFAIGRGIYFLIIPGFLITALLWVFGREFLLLLYGKTFADAAGDALRVLALAVPLRFVETLLAVALDASNRAGKRATAVAIAGVTNALLNILLIPQYQVMGPVYATFLTEVLISGLFVWYLRNEVHEMIGRRVFAGPGLGALLIFVGPLFFGMINVWLSVTLCVLLYALAIVVVDPSTIEPLRQIAIKRRL